MRALEESLLVLRRVVLEVLGEVAVCAGGRDRLDDLLPLRTLELGKLGLELLVPAVRQQLAVACSCHGRASDRSRRSRRSSHRRHRRP